MALKAVAGVDLPGVDGAFGCRSRKATVGAHARVAVNHRRIDNDEGVFGRAGVVFVGGFGGGFDYCGAGTNECYTAVGGDCGDSLNRRGVGDGTVGGLCEDRSGEVFAERGGDCRFAKAMSALSLSPAGFV